MRGVGRGRGYVRRLLDKDVSRRRRSPHDVTRIMSQVTGGTDAESLRTADVVIEAVFEDLALKQRLLEQVEATCRPETIFASNTSAIPIGDIAAKATRPEHVIGMHYFSPVEKMPLLEVVVTDKTADWVTATCVKLGQDQGKTVIVVRDGTGFYTSRILAPYLNEAAWMLSEGADIAALDRAMVKFGFPVGPITLIDEVGIDVGAKVAHVMQMRFGDRVQAPPGMDILLKDDRKGRKNGKGFYLYEKGKKGAPDPTVYALFKLADERKQVSEADIQERLLLPFINEAAHCLEDNILRSTRDGDIGAIFGLGFPPFLGGPFSYIDKVGAKDVVQRLDNMAKRHGKRFEAAPILRAYAKEGKRFRA